MAGNGKPISSGWYQRCPGCGDLVSRGVPACGCGHIFPPSYADPPVVPTRKLGRLRSAFLIIAGMALASLLLVVGWTCWQVIQDHQDRDRRAALEEIWETPTPTPPKAPEPTNRPEASAPGNTEAPPEKPPEKPPDRPSQETPPAESEVYQVPPPRRNKQPDPLPEAAGILHLSDLRLGMIPDQVRSIAGRPERESAVFGAPSGTFDWFYTIGGVRFQFAFESSRLRAIIQYQDSSTPFPDAGRY